MFQANQWVSLLLILAFAKTNGTSIDFEGFQWSYADMASQLQIYVNATESNLSEGCAKELIVYSENLMNKKLWAVKMVDATSKISSGVLSGSTGDIGAFDQCLEIEGNTAARNIHGKYCLGTLYFSTDAIGYKHSENPKEVLFAVCFPSACSAQEVQNFYSTIGVSVVLPQMLCQDKFSQPKLTTGSIIAIVILGLVLAIMVASTIYDVYLYYTEKESAHMLLTAFSIKKNGKTLLEVNNNPSHLLCLHGIRSISQMWVVLEHKYFASFFEFGHANRSHFIEWVENPSSMFILGASVVVDTFLLMGGLVVSYTYLNSRAKGKAFHVLKHYAHRYIRLTPALAAVILFYALVMQFCGSGPLWEVLGIYVRKPCHDYWWSALLYIQNYVNPLETCAIQTWYLSVDMQLFLLSPLLLIPLYKHPKMTLTVVGFLLFGTLLSPFLVAWFYELRRRQFVNGRMLQPAEYTQYYYHPTHTRAAPWFMGFILGYIIFKTKKSEKSIGIKKSQLQIISLGLWALALTVGVGCIASGHDLIVGEYNKLDNTLHIGLVKPLWSLAVAWVIFACVNGYGGPINWFLSHPLFQFLSKVSYGMYLVHIAVLGMVRYSAKTTYAFGNFEMIHGFWGDYMFSLLVATIWVLAFEYPFVTIDKFIFEDKHKDKEAVRPQQNGVVKTKIA